MTQSGRLRISINSMRFTREFRTFLDARLAVFVAITIVVGFGVAHWNGLRAAADSNFAALAYDIGFSQAAWVVVLIVIAAAFVGSFFKGVRSYEGRRFAAQLLITMVIFCALNLALLAFRSTGS